MKKQSKGKTLAKQIFTLSLTNGQVDEGKLDKFLTIIRDSDDTVSKEILSELMYLVEKLERNSTLVLESAFALEQDQSGELKDYFEKKLGQKLVVEDKINKKLIGGIRVYHGDNVWENSVLSNLKKLESKMIYE